MSKIFKSDYLGGIILENLYNNVDKKFTLSEFEKLYGKYEMPYIINELRFMESEGLISKFEISLQNGDTGQPIKPLEYYRITSKGYSFVYGLLKDNKALKNTHIAIGLSIGIPILLFITGKIWEYYHCT